MKKILLSLTAFLSLISFEAFSQVAEYQIIIKNHQFSPKTLEVPANQKIKLTIDNQDLADEKFKSTDLAKERIISGKKSNFIMVGPLTSGTYKYFGEFNPEAAQGEIVVK